YFLEHFGGIFYANPVETAEAANDTVAGAEPMKQQDNMNGTFSYFNEGNIISATDVDHYSMDIPGGVTTVSVFCSAARDGSGLTGFTFEVLDNTGAPVPGASATEALDSDVSISNASIPGSATSLILKLSATGQDGSNTGNYYRCGATLSP